MPALTPRTLGLAEHQRKHIVELYIAAQHTLGMDVSIRRRRFVGALRTYYPWESYERRCQIFDTFVRPLDIEYMTKVHAKRLYLIHDTDVQELFGKFDADGNGGIDLGEFRTMLLKCKDNCIPLDEVERLFCAADTNSDGLLDASEFYHFVASTPRMREIFYDILSTAREMRHYKDEMRRARIFKRDVSGRRPSLADVRHPSDICTSDIPLHYWHSR